MSRFNLQTVGFWDSKNATFIAETLTSAMSSVAVEKGVSVDSAWLRLSPTYLRKVKVKSTEDL